MADNSNTPGWIDDIELENVNVKWAWSHFDGRADSMNDQGDHNFTIILPEGTARKLQDIGWAVRELEPYEEGDPPEWVLKIKISYRFEAPKVYLIKNGRKIRAEERDLADINRATCEQIDVIASPSKWVNGPKSGITAYTKELYATVKESRFASKYADYEEV